MLTLTLLGLLLALGMRFDRMLLESVAPDRFGPLRPLALAISWWGDFGPTCGILLGLYSLAALLARKKSVQAQAREILVALTLALLGSALVTHGIRTTLGRPRPYAAIADGFYGPSLEHRYHGMPSAHTSAASSVATTLVIAQPSLGVPLILWSGAIGWSRMYLHKHHPTDVAFGWLIGALFGLPLSLTLRERLATHRS